MSFIIWLNDCLRDRGWSQRELGRRAGLSSAQVSSVMNGKRNVTWDFCAAISGPLGLHPVDVFQRAGLLAGLRRGEIEARLSPDEFKLLERFRGLDEQARNYLLYAVASLPQSD